MARSVIATWSFIAGGGVAQGDRGTRGGVGCHKDAAPGQGTPLSSAFMRKLLALPLLLACTTTTPPPQAPEPAPPAPYGLTIAEEARVLALEDRREWDA